MVFIFFILKVLHVAQTGTAPFQSLRFESTKGFIDFTVLTLSHPVTDDPFVTNISHLT